MTDGCRRALVLIALATAAACSAVVVVEPADDEDAGPSLPPPQAGAPSGGAPSGGGSPITVGGGSEGGSTSTGPNPDPPCVPDLELLIGAPLEIASDLASPSDLALVGDLVYVTEAGGGSNGSLARLPKLGGEVERVVTALLEPRHLTVSAEDVYWVNWAVSGSLLRFSLADDSSAVLQDMLFYPEATAFHDGSVYVAESNAFQIVVLRPNGTVDELPIGLAPLRLAVDDTGIYVATVDVENGSEAILHVDDTGSVTKLYGTPDFEGASSLSLDGDHLYMTTWYGHVLRGTRQGGPLVTIASVGTLLADAVVADCFVYVASEEDIFRVPVQGGEVQALADEQSLPVGLAIDDDAVYWANQLNGSVMRRLK